MEENKNSGDETPETEVTSENEAKVESSEQPQDEAPTEQKSEATEPPRGETGQDAASYDPKNVHYEGDLAVYTDPKTGTQYEWNSEKSEWRLREVKYSFEGDTHVYTDKDGVKFFWDKEKKAWFPKVDDEFMAIYQLNYGFSENNSENSEEKKVDEEEPKVDKSQPKPKGEKRKASEPTWFEVDETENTKVYVSNLPTDIEEQEFVDLMQKCGLVMKDPTNGSFKVKLYKEPGTGYLKGDALCTYIKIESVELALSLLDGYDYKGHKLKVERAKFQMKGAYDPKLKPKMKKRKEKLKLKKMQEKLFDWRPEKPIDERAKHEKVVIVKNLFDPSIFDTDVGLILEFQEDLREEVSKIGEVRKVMIYDRHPEGVAQINMSSPEEADEVVKLLNGRWFMKRQLTAEIWDGKTKFKIAETDAQINERLENWDKFLEEDTPKNESVVNVDDLNKK
ncbi:17S U2 SnRNP complex component HTATSF1 isoform X2 [Tribolium castaneum]|uniref:17S U2 SnRNP complex component HTATSF1 isoform X2 n=1 Tax=Tribolium castaneum TaxID=7070 RepID=UPI00046C081A|nr:PREDICTED: HIV Tat-specific factor 1 homolog isoform X2 [Tribolium castaneum]|eukprot:XP_008200209.1 PREDICTED: HIV Tat-specific factor 1 homolog isoform X2 [Tribolium castaneum]